MAPESTPQPGSTSGPVAIALGIVSIVLALFISGYLAILAGAVGLGVALAGKSGRTGAGKSGRTGVVLSTIGLVLGLSAQVMRAIVDRAG